MSIVTLMSGGLDSCLMSVLTNEIGRNQKPLFVNYGQLNAEKEYASALNHCKKFGLPVPVLVDISGYGRVISSGITNRDKDIVDEAFLPGRNMMLLLTGSSFAVQNGCTAVSIGLLDESTMLFPDQTDDFLFSAEYTITKALGNKVEIIAPLRGFSKQDVIDMSKIKGISNTYSCHSGGQVPCGVCISCKEFHK
ncbi:MAG: 7-cyano-7-deazaguanine synthase [Gammaproteobacteria bacterium]|nr:7-cyano-7-deazaguanine synthase [Gammaproteobacteria bacterium]MCW8922570.1 7-cyano-7-deazaguanine synthase [Gammaproteobacteria bacterium]